MRELDRMFGGSGGAADKDYQTEIEEYEKDRYIQDPYTRDREMKMKHQEYRTIKVGPPDLLRNGQMI